MPRIVAVKVANDKIVCQVPAARLRSLKGRRVKSARRLWRVREGFSALKAGVGASRCGSRWMRGPL